MELYEVSERVKDKIGDNPQMLKEGEITEIIKSTLQGQFSRDFPRVLIADIAGTDDFCYPLPATSNKAWQKGFSTIESIEYPAGERIPEFIEDDEYQVYQSDVIFFTSLSGTFEVNETITGGTSGATATVNNTQDTFLEVTYLTGTFQAAETITGGTSAATATISSIEEETIRLLVHNPSTTERIRVKYTIAYDEGTINKVPTYDIEALILLSASYYCDALARYYAQSSEGSLDIDTIDYSNKSSTWAERAKDMRTAYFKMTGNKEGNKAASITGDWDVLLSDGKDRLFNVKRYR